MPIKIVIANNYPLFVDGLLKHLENNPKYHIVAILNNGKDVLEYLQNNEVDILLLHLDLPIMNGIDCTASITSAKLKVKIIFISNFEDVYTIKKIVDLGVRSYLIQTITSKELHFAIQKVYDEESYFCASVTKTLLNSKPSLQFQKTSNISPLLETITKREKEVLQEICKGYNNSVIAKSLNISPKTVDVHRTNIMRKLEVHNVVSLVRFALRNGIG